MNWTSNKATTLLLQWKEKPTVLLVGVIGFGFKVRAWGVITDTTHDSLKINLTNGGEVNFDILGASFDYDEIPLDTRTEAKNMATHALQIKFPDRMLVLSEWHGVVASPNAS